MATDNHNMAPGLRSGSTAYDKLREAIVDGEFEPGLTLIENRLASWCGVSRTPVREALLRLEEDGLVERKDGLIRVRVLTPEEILAIYDVRIVLEQEAARRAAKRRSDFDTIEILRLCKIFADVDPSDESEIIRRNRDFHRAIWQATRNPFLVDMIARLNLLLGPQAIRTLVHPGRLDEAIAEHRAIAEAVVAQDADAAAEAATEHFRRARDIILEVWATVGASRA
jgi:DNA-binding GntR family transcriptional regulator